MNATPARPADPGGPFALYRTPPEGRVGNVGTEMGLCPVQRFELINAHRRAIRKLGDNFQGPSHCFDQSTQGTYVHVSAVLEFETAACCMPSLLANSIWERWRASRSSARLNSSAISTSAACLDRLSARWRQLGQVVLCINRHGSSPQPMTGYPNAARIADPRSGCVPHTNDGFRFVPAD